MACLQKESIYPDAHILQAIRQSLKGEARDTLLTVGESATSKDVLIKLNALYGIASSNESIMQQFYLAYQKASENVAQYSIRLENILTIDLLSPRSSKSYVKYQYQSPSYSQAYPISNM